MDLEALAVTVDQLVHTPAAQRGSGRLYAVRCTPDTAGDSAPQDGAGSDAADVILELLAEGEARTLPLKVRPPAGVRAIALASGVWAAPMDDGLLHRSPSRHPQRRRAHLTVLVGVEGEHDAVDVSVLRYRDGSPTVMRGGLGLVHQRMVRCWSRRPEAPWASKRPNSAAQPVPPVHWPAGRITVDAMPGQPAGGVSLRTPMGYEEYLALGETKHHEYYDGLSY